MTTLGLEHLLDRAAGNGSCVVVTTHDRRILPMVDRRLVMTDATITEQTGSDG